MNKKNMIPWAISIGIFILVVLIWVLLGNRGVENIEHYFERDARNRPAVSSPQAQVAAQQEFFSGSAARNKPAVISICIASAGQAAGAVGTSLQGIGSGVIINREGFIITSSRHITDTGDLKVVNFEQTHFEGAALEQGHHHIFDASVVSVFPSAGLAVLKIQGTGFPVARLGDSNSLRMGDWCLAMGNLYGQKPVAASGIISSLNQTINIDGITYRHLIETTCKGGKSFTGGPLINKWGEVAGIVIDNGYAVPSNRVYVILNGLGIPAQ